MAPPKKGASRFLTVILVAIIVVLAAALGIVILRPFGGPTGPTGAITIQSVGQTGVQGVPMQFTLTNLPSGAKAVAYMGDGNPPVNTTSSTFSYPYGNPGVYLILLKVYGADGSLLADTSTSLYRVIISANPALVQAQFHDISIPTLYFNTSRNPGAPIGTTGSAMYLYGGFTENSQLWSSENDFVGWNTASGVNVTTIQTVSIDHYTWDFGNGQRQVITADPSTALPITNPVAVTYANRGIYTASLTLTTVNTTTMQIYNAVSRKTDWNNYTTGGSSFTVSASVAIGTTAAPFKLPTFTGNVPNPGIITEIVNSPGGPYSFDPQIDYETTGFEVVVNTQAALLIYNGSSTTDWLPYIADTIPTTSNGGITNNFQTYTFHIRPGMHFSNGDPITAYDVYYTTIRAMLFQGGAPGTADWIISRYLVPAPYFSAFIPIMTAYTGATAQAEYNAITGGVSYDNTAGTVTFHLNTPTPATLFFTAISDSLGMGIMDAAWLQSVGAGITFSPHGFFDYQNESVEGNYIYQVQFRPVASGPFEINTYVPGQSVVLTPNPYFQGVTSLPASNRTVILEWVASPAVAYQLFSSGQGDIVTLLPPNYYKTINDTLVPNNQAVIKGPYASITEFFNVYNNNISQTDLAKIGSGYSIPSDYFANLWVRKAFAYAFDYATFVNKELGNSIYGFNFGSPYCGVIVPGLPYSVPPSQLTGCPSYDLTQAHAVLVQSGMASTPVIFPYVVPSGDTTDFAMGGVWAAALSSISGGTIQMQPVYQNFATIIGYEVNGSNGMPIFSLGWIADYPYPSDYTDAMYVEGGTYPVAQAWYASYFNGKAAATSNATLAAMYRGEAANWTALQTAILAADAATNPTTAAQLYKQAENLAVQLFMYVYTYQANSFWIVKPYMTPYNNNWGYQTNPTIGAGADSFFAWWVKG